MELNEKKKKALDKQLEFLLGRTERWICHSLVHFLVFNLELGLYFYVGGYVTHCSCVFRYSTMLAENLVDKPLQKYSVLDQQNIPHEERQQNDTKEPGSAGKHKLLVPLLNGYLE